MKESNELESINIKTYRIYDAKKLKMNEERQTNEA